MNALLALPHRVTRVCLGTASVRRWLRPPLLPRITKRLRTALSCLVSLDTSLPSVGSGRQARRRLFVARVSRGPGQVTPPTPGTGAGGGRSLRTKVPAIKLTTPNSSCSPNRAASPSPSPKARRRKVPTHLTPQPRARCQELPLAHPGTGLPAPTRPSTGSSLPSLSLHKALQ